MSELNSRPFTPIKICGLTREVDVQHAVQLGANAIGFVMYAKSPRAISALRAQALSRFLPPFVTPVLLFVNPNYEEVREAMDMIPHALLQFHGDESPAECERFARPYLKAARIPSGMGAAGNFDLPRFVSDYHSARGILLDSLSSQFGGTGESFDWEALQQVPMTHLVLGGGLNADNVAKAMTLVRPKGISLAVDVSSGVESGKGIKDANKMKAFIQAVRAAPAC